MLRVVRGNGTPEELAALVAVLSTRSASSSANAGDEDTGSAEREADPSRWADRAAGLRAPLSPGPGAWRTSLRRP